MKLFSKKIYIGSILGFFVSAIGVIAIFFPSLFNMEKKSIDSFSSVITDEMQASDFYSFLDKKLKTDDIFQLNVEICIPAERLNPLRQDTSDKFVKYPHVDSVIKFVPNETKDYLFAFSKAESEMEYIYPIFANFIPDESKENVSQETGFIVMNQLKDDDKKIDKDGYNAWTGYNIPSEYIFDYYEYEVDSNCFETLKSKLGRDDFGEIDVIQLKGYYTKEKVLNKYLYQYKNFFILKKINNSDVNLKNS